MRHRIRSKQWRKWDNLSDQLRHGPTNSPWLPTSPESGPLGHHSDTKVGPNCDTNISNFKPEVGSKLRVPASRWACTRCFREAVRTRRPCSDRALRPVRSSPLKLHFPMAFLPDHRRVRRHRFRAIVQPAPFHLRRASNAFFLALSRS